MKTLLQKIQLDEQHCFACRTYRTPHFETNWHQHEECELIVINEGHGTVMIGEYIGGYQAGDVYFIASNLPHWFKKQHAKIIGSATVIHFKKNCFGDAFLHLPEMKNIQQFLNKQQGIQLEQSLKEDVTSAINTIDKAAGFSRLLQLLQCLQSISTATQYLVISHDFTAEISDINPAIEKIIDYTFKHYLEALTLPKIAAVANMSIPTFCRFFKKNIKKPYFDFLQDLRISHACKLLSTSNKPVMDICYESGYNSWAHFSKQFKWVKKMTPTQYRNQYEKTA